MTRPKVTEAERQLIAGLVGQAWARARWGPLNQAEEGAAAEHLRGLADGRTDLLAAAAGLMEGSSGELEEDPERREAWNRAGLLCRLAGADPEVIPAWQAEGRRRARRALNYEKRHGLEPG